MSSGFPLYVVSKGRWESRLTNKFLAAMGQPHYIVVEEQEYDSYKAVVELAELLVLPPKYKETYELCDDLGMTKSTGPGPARNFAWDHSIASGAKWHWVMDDNIRGFFRLNYNLKTPCVTPAIFEAMEEFTLRYENVVMAGPNYVMFAPRKQRMPPYITNTRIYSCNFIRNDIPFRWRGRYNEDTDLSLNILKAGLCTIQFNAFLQFKMPTQTVEGGCKADFYDKEGTRPKSEMLARMHPDVAKVVDRFERVHHYVDYSRFERNKLIRKPGLCLTPGVNNFGMILQERVNDEWEEIPPSSLRPGRYRGQIQTESTGVNN